MLFPTHLLAAWLLGRRTRLPTGWLVLGAALPDAVDKPLAAVGVVDLYHSVGHSALLAGLAVPVALLGLRGRAAAVGWASHLLLDAGHVVLNGRPADALFLAWPLAVPPAPLGLAPLPFVRQYLWTPSFFLELALWGAAAVLLYDRRSARRPLGRR